ncbi:hypothetical protein QR680_016812 [Steinernema hermaphroditum]|uniref:Beta-hexosaminidase n=1 Tax=Steinernema hermaphroditum TaxID=289476 RepID=A0AA39HCD6_9BILA|nr:hypothetical protein QR680_016812 [Steinernema hermaphroditum]
MWSLLVTLCAVFGASRAWYYGRPDPGEMTQGGVWPLPWKLDYENTTHLLNPAHFEFVSDLDCDILRSAFVRYKKLAFPGGSIASSIIPSLRSIKVSVKNGCPSGYPQMGMDESYSLTVVRRSDVAVLEANEVWGALRGLETFSQLVYRPPTSANVFFLRCATVEDHPRFPHRGIMIDTVRHFWSVPIILRNIDLAAQNKFNTLHWHLTDSEAFPYESKRYPELAQKGAYTNKHVYSRSDVRRVIDFARLRGIRVVAEFDSPGHFGAWGKGRPELLSKCFDREGNPSVLPNIFDPSKKENFDFLQAFFEEALHVFPDQYMHFGGDEVASSMLECWYRNPEVRTWMNSNGYGNDTNAVLKDYFKKLVQMVQSSRNDTKMIFWQEVLDMNVAPSNSIAHVWKGDTYADIMKEMNEVTKNGHYAILSSCWYLNYIKYGADWGYVPAEHNRERGLYYECNPTDFGGSEAQNNLVLGGEAVMWSEFVDGTNIISRFWPRASAPAERLWSDLAQTQSADKAWPRLHEHRCRMMARGYPVEPPNNPDYCNDFWNPDYPDLE